MTIFEERRDKWIEFMEALPRPKFNFGVWSMGGESGEYGPAEPSLENCQTTACAGGWLPTVFPCEWEYKIYGAPILRGAARESSFVENLMAFFEIPDANQAHRLVYPMNSTPGRLGDNATPQEWAVHARRVFKHGC